MKKLIFPLILYVFSTFGLYSLEWELYTQADWGKRFADQFDKLWPNIRKSPFEMTEAKQEKFESLRDLVNLSFGLNFTPFYQHFFGLGFRYFFSPFTVEQSFSIFGATETWKLSLKGFNPFLAYRFYPIPAKKNIFIASNLGYIFGQMDLELFRTNYEGKAKLNEAKGFSFEVFFGYHFPVKDKTSLFVTTGFEIQRLESFQGTGNIAPPGENVELYTKENYLLPINPAIAYNFKIQQKAILWNNQLRFGLGFLFRFGQN